MCRASPPVVEIGAGQVAPTFALDDQVATQTRQNSVVQFFELDRVGRGWFRRGAGGGVRSVAIQ